MFKKKSRIQSDIKNVFKDRKKIYHFICIDNYRKAGYEVHALGQIKAVDVTFDNTIKALIDLEREMITDEGPIFFPQHVVTDKAIRDASVAADKKLSTFEVDLSMRKEVS